MQTHIMKLLNHVVINDETLVIASNIIKADNRMIKYLPKDLHNTQIKDNGEIYWISVIIKAQSLLPYIVVNNETIELCQKLIEMNWKIIKCIPNKFHNDDMYYCILNKTMKAIKYIPPEYVLDNVLIRLIGENHKVFKSIPRDRLNENICINAVNIDGRLIKFIKPTILTEKMCIDAVKNHWASFKLIPYNFITTEICLTAIKVNNSIFYNIPRDKLTKEMCLIHVSQGYGNLVDIPEHMRDEDVCANALKRQISNYKMVHNYLFFRYSKVMKYMHKLDRREYYYMHVRIPFLFQCVPPMNAHFQKKIIVRCLFIKN